jgi:hypothetical protein
LRSISNATSRSRGVKPLSKTRTTFADLDRPRRTSRHWPFAIAGVGSLDRTAHVAEGVADAPARRLVLHTPLLNWSCCRQQRDLAFARHARDVAQIEKPPRSGLLLFRRPLERVASYASPSDPTRRGRCQRAEVPRGVELLRRQCLS